MPKPLFSSLLKLQWGCWISFNKMIWHRTRRDSSHDCLCNGNIKTMGQLAIQKPLIAVCQEKICNNDIFYRLGGQDSCSNHSMWTRERRKPWVWPTLKKEIQGLLFASEAAGTWNTQHRNESTHLTLRSAFSVNKTKQRTSGWSSHHLFCPGRCARNKNNTNTSLSPSPTLLAFAKYRSPFHCALAFARSSQHI
jgi:hypothetical protein